jgi:Uma2 family endonuclease
VEAPARSLRWFAPVVQSHAMLDLALLDPERPRPLKRVEYDEMVRLGMFDEERVELLHGTIVQMSPGYPHHADPVAQLTTLLVPPLVGRATVRVQLSYWASEDSEPEPDIAVVPLGPWNREHPSVAHLVIEVAASSLRKDRHVKAPLYAASRVTEYWIFNVLERNVEVFRDSDGSVYRTRSVHELGETLSLVAFPDVAVPIRSVFV